MIVGSHDEEVLQWNEDALAQMECTKKLVVVPGATHLFPEPGALVHVSTLARDWFIGHLLKA